MRRMDAIVPAIRRRDVVANPRRRILFLRAKRPACDQANAEAEGGGASASRGSS